MASALLTALILAQLVSPVRRGDLVAAAAASPRPAACSTGVGGARTPRAALWTRAKTPGLRGYCAALARGYARLRRDPARALKAAQAAEQALRGRAAPQVLRGRALMRLGRVAEAWTALSRARSLDRHSLESPATLHDFAVAAALTGHSQDALQAYRALVPQATLLESPIRRQRVYVEAAAFVMQAGKKRLDEAIGYLTEARRQGSPPGYQEFVLGALALALDRQGHPEQAWGVVAETAGPWGLARLASTDEEDSGEGEPRRPAAARTGGRQAIMPVLPPGELHAMIAVLAEREDRELAREHWQAYLRSDPDRRRVWSEHAAQKLRALSAPARSRRGG